MERRAQRRAERRRGFVVAPAQVKRWDLCALSLVEYWPTNIPAEPDELLVAGQKLGIVLCCEGALTPCPDSQAHNQSLLLLATQVSSHKHNLNYGDHILDLGADMETVGPVSMMGCGIWGFVLGLVKAHTYIETARMKWRLS